jgi:hypothetical protein
MPMPEQPLAENRREHNEGPSNSNPSIPVQVQNALTEPMGDATTSALINDRIGMTLMSHDIENFVNRAGAVNTIPRIQPIGALRPSEQIPPDSMLGQYFNRALPGGGGDPDDDPSGIPIMSNQIQYLMCQGPDTPE